MKHKKSIIVLPALLVGACSTVFKADFEADPVNQPPLENPPSSAADSVEVFPGPGEALVRGSSPVSGSQSLVLAGPSGDATPSVIMHSAPLPNGSEPAWVFGGFRGLRRHAGLRRQVSHSNMGVAASGLTFQHKYK